MKPPETETEQAKVKADLLAAFLDAIKVEIDGLTDLVGMCALEERRLDTLRAKVKATGEVTRQDLESLANPFGLFVISESLGSSRRFREGLSELFQTESTEAYND